VAATMHDVGKACIPDQILTKPGPLTDDEWTVMRTHASEGHTLLSQSNTRIHALGAQIAQEHHERWDGSGYPAGLVGATISLPGRISAIADVLDSLVCASCYKPAWELDKALDYIRQESGKHFDPALVELLLTHLDDVRLIYKN